MLDTVPRDCNFVICSLRPFIQFKSVKYAPFHYRVGKSESIFIAFRMTKCAYGHVGRKLIAVSWARDLNKPDVIWQPSQN